MSSIVAFCSGSPRSAAGAELLGDTATCVVQPDSPFLPADAVALAGERAATASCQLSRKGTSAPARLMTKMAEAAVMTKLDIIRPAQWAKRRRDWLR